MSETDEAFVQIPVDDHLEIWPVASRQLRRWLSREYRRHEGKPPSHQAVSEVLLNIEGLCAEGPTCELHNRVAWHDGALPGLLGIMLPAGHTAPDPGCGRSPGQR